MNYYRWSHFYVSANLLSVWMWMISNESWTKVWHVWLYRLHEWWQENESWGWKYLWTGRRLLLQSPVTCKSALQMDTRVSTTPKHMRLAFWMKGGACRTQTSSSQRSFISKKMYRGAMGSWQCQNLMLGNYNSPVSQHLSMAHSIYLHYSAGRIDNGAEASIPSHFWLQKHTYGCTFGFWTVLRQNFSMVFEILMHYRCKCSKYRFWQFIID